MGFTKHLILVLVLASACSSDTHSGGGAGAACVDGATCTDNTLCFVPGSDPAGGTCVKAPVVCGAHLSCDCLDEVSASCANPAGCRGVVGAFTVTCGQGGVFKQEGDACSAGIHCADGLYCFVAEVGEVGICTPNPVSCGTAPSCTCFEGVCADGENCTVLNASISTIECR